jgi:hypothetical protein
MRTSLLCCVSFHREEFSLSSCLKRCRLWIALAPLITWQESCMYRDIIHLDALCLREGVQIVVAVARSCSSKSVSFLEVLMRKEVTPDLLQDRTGKDARTKHQPGTVRTRDSTPLLFLTSPSPFTNHTIESNKRLG